MSHQSDEATRRRVADFAITNDGNHEDLVRQVNRLWQRLSALRAGEAASGGPESGAP
jgi:dephospho-CoA kinase